MQRDGEIKAMEKRTKNLYYNGDKKAFIMKQYEIQIKSLQR